MGTLWVAEGPLFLGQKTLYDQTVEMCRFIWIFPVYQLSLIITALLHVDLINFLYLTACIFIRST